MDNVIVVIPARLNSSRLPEKVILDICGKPMVQYVYELAMKSKNVHTVYIATDSQKVKEICESFTNNIIITSSKHQSGTDRIAEAIKDIDCNYIINIQGDEPLLDSKLIDQLATSLKKDNLSMVSAMHKIENTTELKSINSVKVTIDKNGDALYFSRSIIPNDRDNLKSILSSEKIPLQFNFYKHIGIYGYSKEFLLKYSLLNQTPLEVSEKLEQLRVLENGYKIRMIKTDYKPIGVDTQEDLEKVREIIKCQ
jgi:3-deoxy-manno-octulosonate cytidylyltransferase (CMP-KDO synthetase)